MPNDQMHTLDKASEYSFSELSDVPVHRHSVPSVFPQIIENCASCHAGVDCTSGDQHYCNRCERTLCDDAECHMSTDECNLIPTDEAWCTECMRKSILAAAQIMRDVRVTEVRCA